MFTNVKIKFVDGYIKKLFERPVARHVQGVQCPRAPACQGPLTNDKKM